MGSDGGSIAGVSPHGIKGKRCNSDFYQLRTEILGFVRFPRKTALTIFQYLKEEAPAYRLSHCLPKERFPVASRC